MGRDLGILSPVEFAVSCEAKQDMFRQARWLGYPDLDPIPDPNPDKGTHPNTPQA